VPGHIVLGKVGSRFIGHLDDRPLVTIAGARAGKTSTVLEPNLYLYPGSMLALDPKGELSHTARLRRALGHSEIPPSIRRALAVTAARHREGRSRRPVVLNRDEAVLQLASEQPGVEVVKRVIESVVRLHPHPYCAGVLSFP
jgi:hypothetical protein